MSRSAIHNGAHIRLDGRLGNSLSDTKLNESWVGDKPYPSPRNVFMAFATGVSRRGPPVKLSQLIPPVP